MSGDCYVYVIGSGDDSRPCKIGIAANPSHRLRQLQTGNPVRLKVVEKFWAHSREQAAYWEMCAHKLFERKRMSGEWFDVPASIVVAKVGQWRDDREPKQPKSRREFLHRSQAADDFEGVHPFIPEHLRNRSPSEMTNSERLEFWGCFGLPSPPAGFDDWYLVGSPSSGVLAAFPVVGFMNGVADETL